MKGLVMEKLSVLKYVETDVVDLICEKVSEEGSLFQIHRVETSPHDYYFRLAISDKITCPNENQMNWYFVGLRNNPLFEWMSEKRYKTLNFDGGQYSKILRACHPSNDLVFPYIKKPVIKEMRAVDFNKEYDGSVVQKHLDG